MTKKHFEKNSVVVYGGSSVEQTELEDRLCRWIWSKKRLGLLLDGFKIQTQAKNIAKELNFSRLLFTDGWFRGFKKLYDLHHKIAQMLH